MSIQMKNVGAAFKRRPLLFVCGALVVGLALAVYFRLGVRDEVEAKLAEREKVLLRLSNNAKFSAQLDNQLESLRKANAKIADGALRVGELARNQQLFFRLEAETGVKLLDLRQLAVAAPAKNATPPTYVAIPFNLTIQGDYAQIMNFLLRLDREATLARVKSGTISRPADGAQSLALSVELLGFRS
jgi:Tfp pilus assembly protein PilO